jgi:hypothetical protein
MLNVIILNVTNIPFMLSVMMLNVIMLSVIVLSVILLGVVAPKTLISPVVVRGRKST